MVNPLGRIEVERDDGETAVVALIGVIDMDVSRELRAVLDGLVAQDVVIDMRTTEYIDSVTIGTLVAARQAGQALTLQGATGEPMRVLELSGVDGLFDHMP